MSTETAPQSRGGLRRHKSSRPSRQGSGRDRRQPKVEQRPEPVRQYVTRTCVACGRLFKIQASSPRMRCVKNRRCSALTYGPQSPEVLEAWRVEGEYKAAQEQKYREQRKPYLNAWKRAARLKRKQKQAFMARMVARGWVPRSQRNIPDPMLELSEEDRAEVIALVEEQKKDDRRTQVQWMPSMDDIVDYGDGPKQRKDNHRAVCFDRDDDMWPYYAQVHRGRRTKAHR